jgi:FkbM family methyltransferase
VSTDLNPDVLRAEAPRIRLTTSCRDTDTIPKVAGAGDVVDGPDGRVQVMACGVKVVAGCYFGDWMTEIIRDLRGHHEPQEEVVFHAIVERLVADNPAPVMIELGAFWAYYSLWMLQRSPNARAVLVEPDPNNLAVGVRNFELNGRTGDFVQAAVGSEHRPPAPFECESDGVTREVETVSLQALLTRFALPRVDMLLLDVQGAETALLEGALEVFRAGRVRFALVSTHHHAISGDPLTHQRCLDLLVGAGAHVIAEHTVGESFSGDGMIAVSFDDRDRDLRVEVSHARVGESLFGDPLLDLARATDVVTKQTQEIADLRTELAAVHARTEAVDRDLAAMRSTATWRLRAKLLASSVGRRFATVLNRMLRRAGRAGPEPGS